MLAGIGFIRFVMFQAFPSLRVFLAGVILIEEGKRLAKNVSRSDCDLKFSIQFLKLCRLVWCK